MLNKIKNWWYNCHKIFELSLWVSLDGIIFSFSLLDIHARVHVSMPAWLLIKVFEPLEFFKFYSKDNLFDRPMASVDFETGFCKLLSTGFTLRWGAHDYGSEREVALGILGLNGTLSYWNGMGWDSEKNEYFVLKELKDQD